jgi:hypothetical protein
LLDTTIEAQLSEITKLFLGQPLRAGPVDPKDLFLKFLGVHCAQFPEEARAKTAERIGDPIREGDLLYLPSGVTVVVPAKRVSDLLDIDYFAKIRADRENAYRDEVARSPVPENE